MAMLVQLQKNASSKINYNSTGIVSGSSQVYSGVSGDVTIASNGTAAIGTGVIVDADVNGSAAIASSKINYDGTGIVSSSLAGIFIEKVLITQQITLRWPVV